MGQAFAGRLPIFYEYVMSINLSFDLQPQDALRFWQNKRGILKSAFDALSDDAKAGAFTAAWLSHEGQISTLLTKMHNAIATGQSWQDFRKECEGLFEARGYTEPNPWHLENVFRTNIQSAYNAGRYRQMMEVAEGRPYWRYSAVADERTRPSHLAMHGKIYRFDDPVWHEWYPPNGYRCRCSVESLSQRQMTNNGWQVENGQPLLSPDSGFANNPGENFFGGFDEIRRQAEREVWQDWPFTPATPLEPFRRIPAAPEAPPLPAASAAQFADEFTRRFGAGAVFTDALGEPLLITANAYADGLGAGELIPQLEALISAPVEIWLGVQTDERRRRARLIKRLLMLHPDGGTVAIEAANAVIVTKVEKDVDLVSKRKGKRIYHVVGDEGYERQY